MSWVALAQAPFAAAPEGFAMSSSLAQAPGFGRWWAALEQAPYAASPEGFAVPPSLVQMPEPGRWRAAPTGAHGRQRSS